jgi:acetolactate synthase-1/2/3 large subunit
MSIEFCDETMAVPAGVARVLQQGGISTVFGMPGGKTGMLFDALYAHATIRPVLTREESLATVMAEASGRITGGPGVAIGQTSWLVGNGGSGILEAHLGSSPVVLLGDLTDHAPFSQHAPYQAGTGHPGTWDAAATLRGMVKQVLVAHDPVEAIQSTQLALKYAMAGERGPVVVLYHSSALAGTVGPESRPRLYHTQAYLPSKPLVPRDDDLRAAASALAAAERPVIVAGNGVRNSGAFRELTELAEAIGAGVVTSASGKGVFDETHRLALGTMGNFGEPAANAVVSEADVVLAVGTKLGPSDTSFGNPTLLRPRDQHLIQVDVEVTNTSWTVPVHTVVIGDAALVLARLTELVEVAAPSQSELALERTERLTARKRTLGSFRRPHGAARDVPMHPQRIIETLTSLAGPDCILTCDAGENRLFMNRYFQSTGGGTFLQPAASGGMGYAIPAALAAKLAEPNKAVVAVCGDGGFGISLNGLLTAVEESLPIVVVIFNNQALGWVRHGQGERVVASELMDFDYAGISRAIGCDAWRVDTAESLDSLVKAALVQQPSADRPVVLDVPTSRDETFLDIASPLNRWV